MIRPIAFAEDATEEVSIDNTKDAHHVDTLMLKQENVRYNLKLNKQTQ